MNTKIVIFEIQIFNKLYSVVY